MADTRFRFMDTDKNQQAFNELLCRIEPGEPFPAGQYKQLRHKLIKFFAWRHCEDPEALADETISRLVRNINMGEEIRAANPYSYIYAIAMNIFKEYLREKKKSQEVIKHWQPPGLSVAENVLDCRKFCLEGLSEDKVELLRQYYLDKNRVEMARSKGNSLNALRLQIHRIKNEIRDCYEECLRQSDIKRN